MIVSSAIMLKDGSVFVGERHGDCYHKMSLVGLSKSECNNAAIQGFINHRLVFLNRNDAYLEAYACNQCAEKSYQNIQYAKGLDITEANWKPLLMSEDLW